MQKILVIEDDIDIQDILKNYLVDAGYEVTIASDGVEGISYFNEDISLVLLDIMLPKIDGFGVCEVIRQKSQVPIIMLTALSDEENQLRGFAQKIDDYVSKPFSPQILLCKIEAVLRRRLPADYRNNVIVYKDLRMDIDGFHLYQQEQEILLTQKEFELLKLLLENQGRVFTYDVGITFNTHKKVPQHAIISNMNIIKKTFIDNFLLITFINSVSHPADCLNVIHKQLFSKVFYMAVNNAFFNICF